MGPSNMGNPVCNQVNNNLLNTLGNLNTVTLGWIPVHEGHEGNEMADSLAKPGGNMQPTGTEPFCGLTKNHTNELFRKWEKRQFAVHWLNCADQRQAKQFPSPNKGISDKLSRVDMRLLTGYLTGHCSLRYDFKKGSKISLAPCTIDQLKKNIIFPPEYLGSTEIQTPEPRSK